MLQTLGTVWKSLAAATECEDVTDIVEDALKLAQDLNETIKKLKEILRTHYVRN